MGPAILWVFSQYFPRYRREGLLIPEIAKKMTDEYWKDMDVYEQFKNEYITQAYNGQLNPDGSRVIDKESRIDLSTCFKEFKIWFKMLNEGEKPPTIRDFRMEMVRLLGRPAEDKYWFGLKLSNHEPVDLGDSKVKYSGVGLRDMMSKPPVME